MIFFQRDKYVIAGVSVEVPEVPLEKNCVRGKVCTVFIIFLCFYYFPKNQIPHAADHLALALKASFSEC